MNVLIVNLRQWSDCSLSSAPLRAGREGRLNCPASLSDLAGGLGQQASPYSRGSLEACALVLGVLTVLSRGRFMLSIPGRDLAIAASLIIHPLLNL